MRLFPVLFLALVLPALAQTDDISATTTPKVEAVQPAIPAKPGHTPMGATTAQLQAALDQLTQSNRDLLDLLKKQQAVLEDIQFDRRQQSRRIEALEEHLMETVMENSQLQNKVANLEAAAAVPPSPIKMTPLPASTIGTPNPALATTTAPSPDDTPPPPPATYLPAPETEGASGTKSWHRLFTLKGTSGQTSDMFHVDGRTWRVLWHNQDQPGKAYANTSGLFINAFPKDDTIPQRVCSKVGSGGDSSELQGPGNYYLKIEASGGSWELAVEDFR